jgi:AmmeMemoRadiSam system protein B
MFYPADPVALAALVDRLVDAVDVPESDRLAEAYVVPHAGYRYSGAVAAKVYARLRRHAAQVHRVVLIGPAHRVPMTGCAVTGADRWRTPLGEVAIDTAAAARLAAGGLADLDDRPHLPEHAIEVQVPFLQRVLPEVPLLPVCVGRTDPPPVAAMIAAAGGGTPGTVVLCSTDFSHYLPDGMARERDRRTAAAVMELSPAGVGERDACGLYALRGLLAWAGSSGPHRAVQLALATSAQTGGDPTRVVGYPAFAVHGAQPVEAGMPAEHSAERGQPV